MDDLSLKDGIKEIKSTADAEKQEKVSRAYLKYSGIAVLVVLIVLVIVDLAATPCTLIETESARISRLNRARAPYVVKNGTMNCVSDTKNPKFKLVDNSYCESKYSCTGVALTDFVNWVAKNLVVGAFLYIFAYAICAVICVPGTVLTIGAGIAFTAATNDVGLGILIGSITVFLGATLGATLAFFVGRYLLRDLTQRLRVKYVLVQAIDKAIEREGLKTMFLLRLSPLIPFNALNYIMSGTSISPQHYVIACIGMVPATIVYVYVGVSIHVAASGNYESNRDTSIITLVLLIVGAVCGLLAIGRISLVAKRYFSKLVDAQNQTSLSSD